MKKNLLLFTVICLTDFAAAQRTPPVGYSTILSDDFNGTVLDQSLWTKGLYGDTVNGTITQAFPNLKAGGGTHRLNEFYAGYILDKNTIVNNGHLELHNIKESYTGTNPAGQFDYTNGWINGLGKETFNGSNKSIILRMRMKLPSNHPDAWPAVWLVAQNTWPPEIDIFEYFGSNFGGLGQTDFMALRWIYGENFNKRGSVKDRRFDFIKDFDAMNFQEYEYEWTDSVMICRINGTEYSRLFKGGTGTNSVPANEWPDVNADYSLIINNGRLSSALDAQSPSTSNVFVIDYIDVYEKADALAPKRPIMQDTVITTNSIQLDWIDDPAGGLSTNFDIAYREPSSPWNPNTSLAAIPLNTNTLTGLTPNTDYEIRVRGVNSLNGPWLTLNLRTDQVTNINELNVQEGFEIYPNPSDGNIRIKFNVLDNIYSINILNGLGQLVYIGNEDEIDLTPLPKGVYYVKIKLSGGDDFVRKLFLN